MNRPGFLSLLAAGILLASSAFAADPIKVSIPREEAFRLREALEAIAPGLTPANTIVAADNINALQPIADGVAKAGLRMQREQTRLQASPDRAVLVVNLADDFDAKTAEPVDVDLTPLEISNDEIKEAKIAPKTLAAIRRWLMKRKAP